MQYHKNVHLDLINKHVTFYLLWVCRSVYRCHIYSLQKWHITLDGKLYKMLYNRLFRPYNLIGWTAFHRAVIILMKPFTFPRSVQAWIEQGQFFFIGFEMTTADFMHLHGSNAQDIVQKNVFHPSAQIYVYKKSSPSQESEFNQCFAELQCQ